MNVFGIDFTSAPSARKPITICRASLSHDVPGNALATLNVESIDALASWTEFERFLNEPGPWIGGFDFPFSQPRKLIENLRWSLDYATFVKTVASLGMMGWEQILKNYRDPRPAGDKQHFRICDRLAASCSPMTMHYTPVGRMFLTGAPRLLAAGVCVQPCAPSADSRIAIEAYPALVARAALGGRVSYKSDTPSKQTPAHTNARASIVSELASATLTRTYTTRIVCSPPLADSLIADPTGDRLDAVLCALQVAWAARQPGQRFGIPADADILEGWIADPALMPTRP